MVAGFMAGVALGQQLVGMNKSSNKYSKFNKRNKISAVSTAEQRLQSAKLAAYKRMKARQNMLTQQSTAANNTAAAPQVETQNAQDLQYNDASGQLLISIKKSVREFNDWIKKQTNGLLDLNMSMAIFFVVRGLRKFLIEKQYPSAWQLIWWASSILRGWRFV
ncbi:MAG: hypothetical protein IJ563_01465 [Selenomonadaceae bacterium]|nr:hypothetical protein [Selenomonadaceae bacterium]MBR1858312.1 hypothetical protein [Selenomonadaceae bacterium]